MEMKFTYKDIEDGKLTIDDIKVVGVNYLMSSEKTFLQGHAEEFIDFNNGIYYYDAIGFQTFLIWYLLNSRTNLNTIIDFELEGLKSADETLLVMDTVNDLVRTEIPSTDEFEMLISGSMNQIALAKNIMGASTSNSDLEEAKEMYLAMEDMAKELQEQSFVLEDFTKVLQGD